MKRQAATTGPARFVVGIDLGTTNSVVAFADTHEGEAPSLRVLDIPQTVALAGERSRVRIYQKDPTGWEFPQSVAQKLGWDKNQLQVRKIVPKEAE